VIPGPKHLVFEEGFQGTWLYETLSSPVDEMVVAGITGSRGPSSEKGPELVAKRIQDWTKNRPSDTYLIDADGPYQNGHDGLFFEQREKMERRAA